MTAKYCSQCGTGLTLKFESGRERPTCPHCGFVVYRNPIPVALMLASRAGEYLLVKRRDEPLRRFWAPPTGYVEWNESAEQTALRETREETGLEVRSDGLLAVYSRADTGILFLAYAGQVVGGDVCASDDAEEVRFSAPDELPPQPATHRGTALDVFFLDVISDVMKPSGVPLSRVSQGENRL